MQTKYFRILNVALRVLILGGRLSLLYFVAKFLDVENYAKYILIGSYLAFALYFNGLDIYVITGRIIAKEQSLSKNTFFWMELHLKISIYLCSFAILIYSILLSVHLEFHLVFIVLAILMTETLSQEITRILIYKGRQLKATAGLFIRSGLWGYILAVLALNQKIDNYISLNFVLIVWLCGSFASIIYQLTDRAFEKISVSRVLYMPNKKELKIGYMLAKKSFGYYLNSIAIKFIAFIDKISIAKCVGVESVAHYGFFQTISMLFQNLLDSLLFQFLYPELIRLRKRNADIEFQREISRSNKIVDFIFLIGFSIIYIGIEQVLLEIGKSEWEGQKNVLWILIIAQYVQCRSSIYHLALYAIEKDSINSKIGNYAFAIYIISLFIWTSLFNITVSEIAGLYLIYSLTLYFPKKIQYTRWKTQGRGQI